MADSARSSETDPRTIYDDSLGALLARVLRDGVIGAVAGGAGNAVLFGALLIAALLGGFDFGSLSLTADFLGLGTVLGPDQLVLAGFAVFVLGGLTAWPLILATLGWYLPGEDYAAKGLAFGFVIWTGFAIGYYEGYAGATLAAYLGLTLVGHLGYGFVTGAVMDRVFGEDNPPALAEPVRQSRASTGGSDTASATGVTAGSGSATGANAGTGNSGSEVETPVAPDVGGSATTDDVALDDLDDLDEHEQGVPPLLRFKEALAVIEAELDGDVPPAFTQVKQDYYELVRGDGTPHSRVSDIKSRVTVLKDSLPSNNPEIERRIRSMDVRLDQYMETHDTSETLHISGITFYEDDDPVRSITELQEELATVRITVTNQGTRSGAVVHLEFRRDDPNAPDDRDGTGVLLRSDDLSMGYIEPGGRETMETKVYVPSIAEWYEATVLDPDQGQVFLSDVDAVRQE
ncbi:MAG: DUF6789 family protein [Salinirussus sp.]